MKSAYRGPLRGSLSPNIRASECGFGFHLLRSWSLLYYPSSFSLRTFGILDFVWLGLLVVPFWYWARKSLPTVLGVGLLSVTLIAGQLFPNIKPVLKTRSAPLPMTAQTSFSSWVSTAQILFFGRASAACPSG